MERFVKPGERTVDGTCTARKYAGLQQHRTNTKYV